MTHHHGCCSCPPSAGLAARIGLLFGLAGTLACQGGSSGDGGNDQGGNAGGEGGAVDPWTPPVVDETCEPGEAAPFQLRRLTRSQLDHTISDLLHAEVRPSAELSQDERVGPFYSNLNTPIDNLQVEKFEIIAQDLAAKANLSLITGCGNATGRACAETFVAGFGRRAFRRPLDPEESTLYVGLYDKHAAAKGHDEALRFVLRAFLQSPNLLYHAEFGSGDGRPRLSGFELGARLSYFLWDTMPDDALLEAAAKGELATTEGLKAQFDRLSADPRARAAQRGFHFQWLDLEGLEGLSKSATAYPAYNPAVATAMADDARHFIDSVFDGDARLETLFTSSVGFPDQALAPIYGLAAGSNADGVSPVTFDGAERSGLLTLPAFLAVHAHADQSSPVKRGVIVRTRLLCQDLPPPPDNVNNAVPAPAPDATTRERFAAHESDPACASCHTLIDPIGLGFENYDAIGQYRAEESGQQINATGEIFEAGDMSGAFDGAAELSRRLAGGDQVAECVTRQWFNFALGRKPAEGDRCLLDGIKRRFVSSGGNLNGLIAAIVASPAFAQLAYDGVSQ